MTASHECTTKEERRAFAGGNGDHVAAAPDFKSIEVAIVLIAVVLRVGCMLLADNAGGDALARESLAANWLLHPTANMHFGEWPPLHIWLVAGASLLFRSTTWGGRILSCILGCISVYYFSLVSG
jgi:hypothetical protein